MTTRAYFEAARIATPQGLAPVLAAADVTSVPTRGTGLSGELFLPGSDISTFASAERAVRKVPDARFVAPRLAHSSAAGDTTLAEGLGPAALAKIDALAVRSSALTLSGFIFIPAGVHEIEVISNGGVRLELGGLDFIEMEAATATDTAAAVADFEGGLYEIDLLSFDASGLVLLGLRIDGLPTDQSAFYRRVEDFEAPPNGTPMIPVDAYHPCFFLAARTRETPGSACAALMADGLDEFGDDDMILGLGDDKPPSDPARNTLLRRETDHGRDRKGAHRGRTAQLLLERAELRGRRQRTRMKAAPALLPTERINAGTMIQWVRPADADRPSVICNAMRVNVIGPMVKPPMHDRPRIFMPRKGATPESGSDAHGAESLARVPAVTHDAHRTGDRPGATATHPWLQSGAVALASSLMGTMEPPVVLMAHDGGDFFGPSQPVLVPHAPIHAIGAGTWAFRFTAHTPGNDQIQALFSKVNPEGPGGGHLIAYLRGDGVLKIEFQGEDGQTYLFGSGVTIMPNQRYDLAFSFDEDEMNLYLDGELVDSDMGCPDGMLANSEDLVLGAAKAAPTANGGGMRWHFNGCIENVLLLDRALTDVEAVFLAQAGGDIMGLQALYGLGDEADGVTPVDDLQPAEATPVGPLTVATPSEEPRRTDGPVDSWSVGRAKTLRRAIRRRQKAKRKTATPPRRSARPISKRPIMATRGKTEAECLAQKGLAKPARPSRLPLKAAGSAPARKAPYPGGSVTGRRPVSTRTHAHRPWGN